jgi:hypothetical protein
MSATSASAYGRAMRVPRLCVLWLVAAALLGAPTASGTPALSASRAPHGCGKDFDLVVSKPITAVDTGAMVGKLLLKERTGEEPAYCGDAVLYGRWGSDTFDISLFMISYDYQQQLYDSTYSTAAHPDPICLSTAAVDTGQGIRLQVRMFRTDDPGGGAVAKAAARTKVATVPTVADPFAERAARLRCYYQNVD